MIKSKSNEFEEHLWWNQFEGNLKRIRSEFETNLKQMWIEFEIYWKRIDYHLGEAN